MMQKIRYRWVAMLGTALLLAAATLGAGPAGAGEKDDGAFSLPALALGVEGECVHEPTPAPDSRAHARCVRAPHPDDAAGADARTDGRAHTRADRRAHTRTESPHPSRPSCPRSRHRHPPRRHPPPAREAGPVRPAARSTSWRAPGRRPTWASSCSG